MKLIKHTKYIYEYQNFVDGKVCDEIVSLIESADVKSDWFFSKNKIRNNNAINLTRFGDFDYRLKRAENIVHEIFSQCNNCYATDNIMSSFIINELCIRRIKTNYVYRFYNENDYYDWHTDYDKKNRNLFSYILYLNDDFDGGNILFLNDKLKVKPKKGSMICFPCDFYTIHKSSKIYKGNKKIIWSCVYED